jgi:alginate O-acetyltransferase complex protein AlgI
MLLWGVARSLPESRLLLRGWTGMCGAVLLLHFGIFRLTALFWQTLRVDADPIMSAPLRSRSLSEFWGKRWNRAFHQLAYDLIFVPLQQKLGARTAGFTVFLVSGLIHDLVISLPARAGFGLPTLYFVLQGAGAYLERSCFGRQLGLRRGLTGRVFMALVVAGPVFFLFHPPFVLRVIIPFMKVIGAL